MHELASAFIAVINRACEFDNCKSITNSCSCIIVLYHFPTINCTQFILSVKSNCYTRKLISSIFKPTNITEMIQYTIIQLPSSYTLELIQRACELY